MSINPYYLAGVMDSDGSFSITKRHCNRKNVNFTCMVSLSWTVSENSLKFIESMCAQFGGSFVVCYPSGTKNYPNSKPVIEHL